MLVGEISEHGNDPVVPLLKFTESGLRVRSRAHCRLGSSTKTWRGQGDMHCSSFLGICMCVHVTNRDC
jgi:hypothetical protein